ncbi:antitoxin CcdA [Caulobacter ginsengisoli]|uniref:Antitoxin CcdA n=1 Tax=Caulobacter ginsengisoli TaxID=400775 RepID=A0ABU0INS5_9CAUL|nr:type II toxin-antitoxin system CcdA family antitoxin [Caulobacter ginsengisoli]MDQ0463609.1 antitoxin CcdA [Caulobacter ginsengisoli]
MGKAELKIEIDADLLETARQAGMPLELVVEDGLRRALAHHADLVSPSRLSEGMGEERAKQWASDNAEAIAEFNQRVAERGLISAEWRRW